MSPRSLRSLLALAALVAAGLGARATSADDAAPVVVKLEGARGVRVRLAAGEAMPCDSSADKKLFDGRLEPGHEIHADVGSRCVCVQHTSQGFDTDWSPAELACRPVVCTGAGITRRCEPAPDPTIRVTVTTTTR